MLSSQELKALAASLKAMLPLVERLAEADPEAVIANSQRIMDNTAALIAGFKKQAAAETAEEYKKKFAAQAANLKSKTDELEALLTETRKDRDAAAAALSEINRTVEERIATKLAAAHLADRGELQRH